MPIFFESLANTPVMIMDFFIRKTTVGLPKFLCSLPLLEQGGNSHQLQRRTICRSKVFNRPKKMLGCFCGKIYEDFLKTDLLAPPTIVDSQCFYNCRSSENLRIDH